MESLTSWIFSSPSPTSFNQLHELKFFIHDEEHSVKTSNVPPDTTLSSYLRNHAHLTGTKTMCHEGGCGSCIVAVTIVDPITERDTILSVNSCLVPIYTCSGWKIHTSESLGNPTIGYHPVQKALVQFNGTQCGFCSSGMLMNMYALYESGQFTMKEVENSFGGNMCRCTGYRPIMSAFKSLASDASTDLLGSFDDIEDIPVCKKTQGRCQSSCQAACGKKLQSDCYDFGESRWIKVCSVNEILDVLRGAPDATYMLIGGNTATGLHKRTKEPDIYIDITRVKTLLHYTVTSDSMVLGANMTMTNAMSLFYTLAKENVKFAYLEKLGDQIDLCANVPIRNTGTLAGNLMIKHGHHEFPSDIYVMLEAVGATLTIVGTDHQEVTKTLVDFLWFDMTGKIITNITLPALDQTYRCETYKIMPRAQSAVALLNAGFLFKLDTNNNVESARIVFGAINPSFTHATRSEASLTGKNLFDNNTLQNFFATLDQELEPDHVPPAPSPEFRKKLSIALSYKFILSIAPENKISPENKSGGAKQQRAVSSGTQDFDTNRSLYPLTQPIPKIEALTQCTGQAKYIMDMPDQPGQLYAAFVLAKAPAFSIISKIDASEALKLDGVVAFYDKGDIPGANDFTNSSVKEEIFCSGEVKFYFQQLGLIVATSQELAEKAADMVEVSYIDGKRKPLTTIRDILATNAKDKIFKADRMEPKSKGNDIKHVIQGTFDISWQYHYTMETQCCAAIPIEDGLDLYPSTQWMTLAQTTAAKALKIPSNKINVSVRRIGGGFGSKINRNALVSCAAAIAAYKLQKPVKLSMSLTTNMNVVGKRHPLSLDYEVGVNDKGGVQYLTASLYSDLGSEGGGCAYAQEILWRIQNTIYKQDTWDITAYATRTDCHTATSCRSPGTTEAVASIENIMQHIAVTLDLDPLQVRLENLTEPEVSKYISDLVQWAEVEKRQKEVEEFNKANRWVKRGMAQVAMLFNMVPEGYWHAYVAIYEDDGSVSVSHGGIEMGQGINTKVAQVCAYTLEIPLDQVSVKPSSVLVSPNDMTSGGSITSEAVCYAVLRACATLKNRMKPIKEKMHNPTWLQLVRKSYQANVDLAASSLFEETVSNYGPYAIYGTTCAEVEVDILTGLTLIKRVDIVEDAGNSMSPEIDIGQVEGAFVMGMGYWMSERILFGEEGEMLTNRTTTYKPPGAKDIPVDFRVKFPKNNPNPVGVLKSKATAEPPLCMACAVPFAIRKAVEAARLEADPKTTRWYPIDGPSTVENTFSTVYTTTNSTLFDLRL